MSCLTRNFLASSLKRQIFFVRFVELLVLLLSLLVLTACTTVHIYNPDGKVDISRHLGIVFVKVEPGEQTMIIDTKSVGLSRAVEAFNIGYLDETVVLAKEDCHLIVFGPKLEHIEHMAELLKGQNSVCFFDKTRRIK